METIRYTITARDGTMDESHKFRVSFDNEGNVVLEESYNPVTGWTGYTQFSAGWSHFEFQRNELRNAIKDYATSEELANLIGEIDLSDVGKTFSDILFCNQYVTENRLYDFEVKINDIERDDT